MKIHPTNFFVFPHFTNNDDKEEASEMISNEISRAFFKRTFYPPNLSFNFYFHLDQ